jgi:alpha-L-arabinofuranosidase
LSNSRIEVDVRDVICATERRIIGINIDYLVDHDENREPGARPLLEALQEMGVKSLRFPGGDKSDNHLWSVPPFERPEPTLACGPREGREVSIQDAEGNWKVRLMDFDEFMGLTKALGADPTLCTCYDALYKPGCDVTKEQLLETAVAWVEYANVKQKYGVKYWEIGNEGYIDATVSPHDYARDLIDFAKAMKKVDPTILIGANGPPRTEGTGRQQEEGEPPWWKIVYEAAAEHIDIAVVHTYSCFKWGSYEYYRDHSPGYPEAHRDAMSVLEAARKWGPPGFADRLRITDTELNSADWSEDGWPRVNDLGHGLVTFDLLGTLLEIDTIDMAQLWNTRWVSHPPDVPSLWDAVDDKNELQPTGKALAIWTQFLRDEMLRIGEPKRMRTFASCSKDRKKLSIFLINKDEGEREATVSISGGPDSGSAQRWVWQGEGPGDFEPKWSGPEPVAVNKGKIALSLPSDSLTVLEVGDG